jgi:ubiquinone/menaquinone biosynthesis C-methylase UbiE
MKLSLIPKLTAPGGGSPLQVATVIKQVDDDLRQGTLLSAEHGIFQVQQGILDLLPTGVGSLSAGQLTNLLPPVARFYEKAWRTHALSLLSRTPLHFAREKNILFEMVGTPQGDLWLDLAASTGLYSRWLAPHLLASGGSVVCLDYSLQMLRHAQTASVAERHPNIGFVAARGERLPFARGMVDGVLCGGSLNEFGANGVVRVLRDLYRVLKPGGVGVFMHLLSATRPLGILAQQGFARPGGIEFWTREESDALFINAGFTVEARKEFGVVAFTRITKPS